MKAIIMAGGAGTRLRPLTEDCPKPMIPFFNKPVLGHLLDLLQRCRFSEVIITVQYLADQIRAYCGDGRDWGLTIRYAVEEKPLGTAGGVKHAQSYLTAREPFLVLSGDLITDLDLSGLLQFHTNRQALVTLGLKQVEDPTEYGVAVTDRQSQITEFVEKPDPEQIISRTVNTGIYVLAPEVLDDIEPGVSYDFSDDLFPKLLRRGEIMLGYGVDGYWRDMGTIEDYKQVTHDVLAGEVGHIDKGAYKGKGIWLGESVEIEPQATLHGPLYLGRGVTVKAEVIIQGPAAIYDNAVIDRGAWLERSIIGSDCWVGEGAKVQDCVAAKESHLEAGSTYTNQVIS